jgi:hypothetical protein
VLPPLITSSRIEFYADTKITINNQQSPEVKDRIILGFTKMAKDGKVL